MDPTTTSLTEDLQELQLERITKPVKSAEEIERLTVDEELTGIERAVYLLSSGQEIQRISVISNLPDLLKDNHTECMKRVVPKVREVLHVAQAEMQMAAAAAFLQILQKELIPLQNYTQTFLQTILTSVDSKDPDIATAWLETLLDVIDLLPKDVIKQDILGIAVAKGQLSQSVQARLSCCKILGKIATKFEPFVIKKEILPVVQSLCQDVDYEVRGCMCRQLDPVARGLGLESTKSAILPELVELTNDEESYVRIAGLETVVNILSLLDDETCTETIIPLVCKFCQQALQADDTTLPVVAKQIGKLCHGLSVNLTDEQKQWFVDYFKKLCKIGVSGKHKNVQEIEKEPSNKSDDMQDMYEEDQPTECRRHAAFNFPAMVMVITPKSFKSELYNTFSSLCKDPHIHIRRTVSGGLHEVVKLLGSYGSILQNELIQLLSDDSVEVLKGVVSNLPQCLEALGRSGGGTVSETRMNSLSEIIPALLPAEGVISSSNNWRLQEELMRNMSCLPKYIHNEVIYEKIIPRLFLKLRTSRALPVRHAAAHSLIVLIRHLKKLEHREEMYQQLIDEFCHAWSCYHRILFIDICKYVLELYSKVFFKEHFFSELLELTDDKVPNVRLKMCSILPDLKKLIKLPSDRDLLQQLELCVRRLLINETDRDVSAAIKQSVEELDKIHVQMESLTKRMYFEDDHADQKKEEEEKKMIEEEEREKEEEDNKSVKAEKKKSNKKDNGTSKIPAPRKAGSLGKTPVKDKLSSQNLKKTPSSTSTSPTASSSKAVSNKAGKTSTSARSGNVSTPTSAGSSRKGSTTSLPGSSGGTVPRRGSVGSTDKTANDTSKTPKKVVAGANGPTSSKRKASK